MKIRDLVRRPLARLFGRPATRVSPQLASTHPRDLDAFMEKLAEFNRDAEIIKAGFESGREAERDAEALKRALGGKPMLRDRTPPRPPIDVDMMDRVAEHHRTREAMKRDLAAPQPVEHQRGQSLADRQEQGRRDEMSILSEGFLRSSTPSEIATKLAEARVDMSPAAIEGQRRSNAKFEAIRKDIDGVYGKPEDARPENLLTVPIAFTGPEAVREEVERRLAALDILPDADKDTVQRMVAEAIGDLPGVRLGAVVGPHDDEYEAMAKLAAEHKAVRQLEHPKNAAMMPGATPDKLPWSTWAKWMASTNAPAGWSPCRFGTRQAEDATAQMFGITRGEFGVYTRPFYICGPVHDEQPLAALIHLPTGTGVGIFMSQAMAVEAGELAMALGVDWRTEVNPEQPDTWADLRTRMMAVWNAAGLHIAPFHAHNEGDDGEIPIWMSTHHTKTAGKPSKEKLS